MGILSTWEYNTKKEKETQFRNNKTNQNGGLVYLHLSGMASQIQPREENILHKLFDVGDLIWRDRGDY